MGKKILIVESGIPVVPFEQGLLLRRDHDMHRAATAEEALQKIGELSPHLVITDDRLSDMNGVAFVEKVRSLKEGRRAAIIYISSDPSQEKPIGVNTVLKKPVTGVDFNEACQRLLSIAVRGDARLLVYVQVQGFHQSSMFLCNSINLSASGILILTARRLKIGDKITLQITLPHEREKVRVEGTIVRRAEEVESRLNGYGVRFENVNEDDSKRIAAFVDSKLAITKEN